MKIIVNDERKEINNSEKLTNFLEDLKIDLTAIVVEYNEDILTKDNWHKIILKENDKINLIRFVGGG